MNNYVLKKQLSFVKKVTMGKRVNSLVAVLLHMCVFKFLSNLFCVFVVENKNYFVRILNVQHFIVI